MNRVNKIFSGYSKNSRKKVAAYARVSMLSEYELHSFAAQVSYYDGYIRGHIGWEFAGVYADEGISGTSSSNRREFSRLISDCEEGKIDVVLTKSISRFARNTVCLLQTVRHLKEIGVEVIFERENISSFDGKCELMMTILASFAQEESRSISDNVKWGIRRGFERGKMNAFIIYGYRAVNGRLEVVPEEAEIVKLIFRNYLDGYTAAQTERQLADMGVTSYRGKHFSKDSIRKILKQEKYTGSAILQKYYIENHITHKKRRNKGELPMYYVSDSHEAIIDKETFDRVQEEIARRYELGIFASGAVVTNCFTSRIRCEKCGRNYRRYGRYYKNGDVRRYWGCSSRKTRGTDFCDNENIDEEQLKRTCALAMGEDRFDGETFARRISGILVTVSSTLKFMYADDSSGVYDWRKI